jgi:long-chain acyl-CoA synthetase
VSEAGQPVFVDISTRLSRHAEAQPDADTIICGQSRITYRDLDLQVSRCANALIGLGIKPGDRVAILASPSVAYLEAFLGTLRAGGCVVPLSPMASPEQLSLMIADCAAKALFVSESAIEHGRRLASGWSPLKGGAIVFDGQADGFASYAALLAGASDQPPGIPVLPEMLFNIIYSSGTTGTPKGIVHSHATRTMTLDRFGDLGFGHGCRSLVATPLYSNTTLAAWLPTLGLGGAIILMAKFDAHAYLELAARERATHTILVPVQFQRILADPDFDRFDLSAFAFKMTTSAPMQTGLKREAARRWPGPLIEMYGLTEGGGICTLDIKADDSKLDSVGKPAFGCVIKIIDERGEELPRGQVGEIVGHGPIMMQGYHNQPDRTAEIVWHDRDGERFFRSGDMGWFDREGYLHLSDRKKDMIISGGFNVFAADLESVLCRHPDVSDAAVIGIPSLEWGETPLAFVEPRTGRRPDADALREWANGQLGKAQRLARVEIRDMLPRNALGKVLKRELRQPYWTAQG